MRSMKSGLVQGLLSSPLLKHLNRILILAFAKNAHMRLVQLGLQALPFLMLLKKLQRVMISGLVKLQR